MINPQLNQDDEDKAATPAPTTNEAMLRCEIGFWQELIESGDLDEAPEALERMKQALALAECRLAALFEEYKQAAREREQRPSNVYYLEKSRRPSQ